MRVPRDCTPHAVAGVPTASSGESDVAPRPTMFSRYQSPGAQASPGLAAGPQRVCRPARESAGDVETPDVSGGRVTMGDVRGADLTGPLCPGPADRAEGVSLAVGPGGQLPRVSEDGSQMAVRAAWGP